MEILIIGLTLISGLYAFLVQHLWLLTVELLIDVPLLIFFITVYITQSMLLSIILRISSCFVNFCTYRANKRGDAYESEFCTCLSELLSQTSHTIKDYSSIPGRPTL